MFEHECWNACLESKPCTLKVVSGLVSAVGLYVDFEALRGRIKKNVKHESCSLGCFLATTRTDFQNKAPMAFIFMKNRELVMKTKFQRVTEFQTKTGTDWGRTRKYSKHKSFRSSRGLELS